MVVGSAAMVGGGRGQMQMHGPTLHEVTRDHIIMTASNFVIAIFRHETTLGGVRVIQRVYDEHARVFPKGVYMLTLVEQSAPLPGTQERDALAKFLASGAGRTRMSAVIHEGTGFRAAMVRGVVTGLTMVARLPYPHKIFATLEEAASWFGTTTHKDVDPDLLVKVVTEARQAVELREAAGASSAARGESRRPV